MNLAGYSQAQLDEVAGKLNARPRKTLAYETPPEVFLKGVALTCRTQGGVLRSSVRLKYAFIARHQKVYSVLRMCRMLQLYPSVLISTQN
jgi:hypothetical protein